jgi:hypothetical protein
MQNFSVAIRWNDRRVGPTGVGKNVSASNMVSAIGKAVRETFKGMTRAQKFDAGKSGLTVQITKSSE